MPKKKIVIEISVQNDPDMPSVEEEVMTKIRLGATSGRESGSDYSYDFTVTSPST